MQMNDDDHWRDVSDVRSLRRQCIIADPTDSEEITLWFSREAIKIMEVSSNLWGDIDSLCFFNQR